MESMAIGSPSLWAKFGIEGLVIFALFMSLLSVVVLVIKRFDMMDERNKEAILHMMQSHKEERDEWRDSNNRQIDKFEESIKRLADGIYDTRK